MIWFKILHQNMLHLNYNIEINFGCSFRKTKSVANWSQFKTYNGHPTPKKKKNMAWWSLSHSCDFALTLRIYVLRGYGMICMVFTLMTMGWLQGHLKHEIPNNVKGNNKPQKNLCCHFIWVTGNMHLSPTAKTIPRRWRLKAKQKIKPLANNKPSTMMTTQGPMINII